MREQPMESLRRKLTVFCNWMVDGWSLCWQELRQQDGRLQAEKEQMKAYLKQFRQLHESKVGQFTADLENMAHVVVKVHKNLKRCVDVRAKGQSDDAILQKLLKDLSTLTDAMSNNNGDSTAKAKDTKK